MAVAAKSLELAGAKCILICANTMHLTINAIKRTVLIPVIHMAKATAKKMIAKHIKTVDSLGTKYTIKKDFYTQVLKFFRITAIIPNLEDRNAIHNTL